MFIYPNSTIKILRNVPLDPSFDHTIFFTTPADQQEYFNSKVKYTLTNQTYQRVKKEWMRIGIQAENLYDCNYIMFQNTSFGSKWFYAFITAVEYINDSVSEIRFFIDPMQSWHFDYLLEECFVEREHSASDTFNNWNVEEDLNYGDEYIFRESQSLPTKVFDMNEQKLCILQPNIIQGQRVANTFTVGNVTCPMNVKDDIDVVDTTSLDNFLSTITDVDNVQMIYQYPSKFYNVNHATLTYTFSIPPNFTLNTSTVTGLFDDYQPRNGKLFCYPYNFILATNHSGETAIYRWEDWADSAWRGHFDVKCAYISTPQALMYPRYYRGISQDWDSGLVYNNFPQNCWSSDAYKAWWAQKYASSGVGVIANAVGQGAVVGAAAAKVGIAGVGMSATGAAGATAAAAAAFPITAAVAGIALLGSIIKTIGGAVEAKHTPNQLRGQTQTESINNVCGKCQFTLYYCTIKDQYKRILDDFFDRFGYASKSNKVPYRHIRPTWTYTKTAGCNLIAQKWSGSDDRSAAEIAYPNQGGLPQDDVKAICSIYDKGITFWKYTSGQPIRVGDYSQNNAAIY